MNPAINYIIAFLLGSYTVATIDDLKRMSASSSFVQLWLAISFVAAASIFVYEPTELMLKIITALVVYVLFSTKLGSRVLRFRIAWGDYTAILPLIFLFNLFDFVVFMAAMVIIDFVLLRTLYVKIKKRANYPFMPAVTLALFIVSMPNLLGISFSDVFTNLLNFIPPAASV